MLTLVLLCSTPPLEVRHYYCGSSGVLRSGLGFLEHTVPYGLTSCVSSRWSSPPILSPAHSIPLLAGVHQSLLCSPEPSALVTLKRVNPSYRCPPSAGRSPSSAGQGARVTACPAPSTLTAIP